MSKGKLTNLSVVGTNLTFWFCLVFLFLYNSSAQVWFSFSLKCMTIHLVYKIKISLENRWNLFFFFQPYLVLFTISVRIERPSFGTFHLQHLSTRPLFIRQRISKNIIMGPIWHLFLENWSISMLNMQENIAPCEVG